MSVRIQRTDGILRRGAIGALLALCLGGAAAAQHNTPLVPVKPPSPDPQNISGVWYRLGAANPVVDSPVPANEKGLALENQRVAMDKAGTPIASPGTQCQPEGLPIAIFTPYPFQIIQTPGRITIIQEGHRSIRRIWMDRKLPANPESVPVSFMGYSVGHWEGDTLVVETIRMREGWAHQIGWPFSPKAKVTEHFRKIDKGMRLAITASLDDPTYYTKPWKTEGVVEWRPDEAPVEYVCEEGEMIEPGWTWPNTDRP
jgi:hypothetical protein